VSNRLPLAAPVAAVVLALAGGAASAQTSVNYGRITNVTLITEQNRAAQTGGAVIGGALGAASARNRSGGTAALRAGAGVLGGQAIGRVATQRQAFEYTILIDGRQTITMVTDEAGLRVGDCVAVERGAFNNLRLVDDSRCNPRPAAQGAKAAPPKATAADIRHADACIQAKDRLLDAETEEDFERAYRRVRLLCQD
jgi:outer membrane lipoprotein SlyB